MRYKHFKIEFDIDISDIQDLKDDSIVLSQFEELFKKRFEGYVNLAITITDKLN